MSSSILPIFLCNFSTIIFSAVRDITLKLNAIDNNDDTISIASVGSPNKAINKNMNDSSRMSSVNISYCFGNNSLYWSIILSMCL